MLIVCITQPETARDSLINKLFQTVTYIEPWVNNWTLASQCSVFALRIIYHHALNYPFLTINHSKLGSSDTCSLHLQSEGQTTSIAFRHLPPNSARFSYATEGALFISRAAVHRRGQRPPKGSGTNQTPSTWFTASFLQPLPYLVTP